MDSDNNAKFAGRCTVNTFALYYILIVKCIVNLLESDFYVVYNCVSTLQS